MSRRPYVREIAKSTWFLRQPRYVRYMTRELSCLFIGAYALMMVWGLKQLADGPAAWAAFVECLRSPASVVFHVVALAFALYHTVTWFNLTPKAMPLQVGEDFVADGVIVGAHYAGWGLLSLAVLYFAGAF